MSDTFWTALFGNLPAIVAAIGVIFAARWARQTKHEVVTRDERADGKLEDLKELGNGTMHALKEKLAGVTSELEASTHRVLELTSLNADLVKEMGLVKEMFRKALLRIPPEDPS